MTDNHGFNNLTFVKDNASFININHNLVINSKKTSIIRNSAFKSGDLKTIALNTVSPKIWIQLLVQMQDNHKKSERNRRNKGIWNKKRPCEVY